MQNHSIQKILEEMNKVPVTKEFTKITDMERHHLLRNKEVSQALKEKGKDNNLPNTEIDMSGRLLCNNGKVHSNRLTCLEGVVCRNVPNIKLKKMCLQKRI